MTPREVNFQHTAFLDVTLSPSTCDTTTHNERGAALVISLIVLALLSLIALSVLATVSTEANVAGSDLQRTRTFYAAEAGLEKMTNDFNALFRRKPRPTRDDLDDVQEGFPTELTGEGFTAIQTIVQGPGANRYVAIPDGDFAGLQAGVIPYSMQTRVTMNTGTQVALQREMNNYLIPIFQFGVFGSKDLEFWPKPPMTFNGRVHANGNIYFGGNVTFESRVTTAAEAVVGNGTRSGGTTNTKLRNNGTLAYTSDPRFAFTDSNNNRFTVSLTQGSVTNGPKLTPQPRADKRGDFSDSPAGTDNSTTTWKNNLISNPVSGTPNKLGSFLLTKSTGASKLELPLELGGKDASEIIRRRLPSDVVGSPLSDGRYHTKATIRVLIDDETAGSGAANAAGIPAGRGVLLSAFVPSELNGGNALRPVNDSGSYAATLNWKQGDVSLNNSASVVRGVKKYAPSSLTNYTVNSQTGGYNANTTTVINGVTWADKVGNAIVPSGAGIKGRILIEVVPAATAAVPNPAGIDVTQEILSMGVTVGEPNVIFQLQRPAWAAFMQGGRDRKDNGTSTSTRHNYLNYFLDNGNTDSLINNPTNRRCLADGEIASAATVSSTGYLTALDTALDDSPTTGNPFTPSVWGRDDVPPTAGLNEIVPINIYNPREGRIHEFALANTRVYTRGITSVIDINMRNLARWVDGVYDSTLLSGTDAVSSNIGDADGYVVYISDRRGDRIKSERESHIERATGKLVLDGAAYLTTNGTVDNENIYNWDSDDNGDETDPGEDVIDAGYDPSLARAKKGILQVDLRELPSPVAAPTPSSGVPRFHADYVNDWGTTLETQPPDPTKPFPYGSQYHFRRAVRLMNGEDLRISTAANRLSTTKGITVATENMVYIWGNYNTTGINAAPTSGSSLNDTAATSRYTGDQIPTSIVADAFFPLSKTWYDVQPAMYPQGGNARIADAGFTNDSDAIAVTEETAVRAGIIAGSTLSALNDSPPSGYYGSSTYYLAWLNGGVHNYPRFLEKWTDNNAAWEDKRWNYVGSFIYLYNSMQAVGPWAVYDNAVYSPPERNWAFDITFTDPDRLPPGTPLFQYVQPTGFRQVLAD
ncbi:MAG: pilus assembly PilX N-terminal domain-containing protein [Pyrinomonadaceae bacterium MAG19_C2-C3]|nr:pilus assembly PilX N-terminal domain-containing protein [Pyrinomonadaceae bacterium MAG19_C2-C3]